MARRLFDRVQDLAERLDAFTAVPARSKDERAVYDAWRAALQPRVRRMVRRVEKVGDPKHWEFDEALEPDILRPASWNVVVREVAALYTELAGALLQHERVRIVWTPKVRFGVLRGTSRPITTAKTKEKDVQARKKALEVARKAKMKSAKKVLDGVVERLTETRLGLKEALQEVRHLVAVLQKAEEHRLSRRVLRLKEGESVREKAEDLLVDMLRGRLKAERFRSERPAEYGSHLRQDWLVPRAKLIPLVDGP